MPVIKRSRKKLIRIELIVVLQLLIFIISVSIALGYTYSTLFNVKNLFNNSSEQIHLTLNEAKNSITHRQSQHIKILNIYLDISRFKYQFELLILDPDLKDTEIRQISKQIMQQYEDLKAHFQTPLSQYETTLLDNIAIILDIGEELLITASPNSRQQLFRDTEDPINEITLSIKNIESQFKAENNALNKNLLVQMDQTNSNLKTLKSNTENIETVQLLILFLIVLVPGAIQIVFFRILHKRLLMLEGYATDIAQENFSLPPFSAKDKTGHLAIQLALMGRRLRQLLNFSRNEHKRANEALEEVKQLAYYDPLTGLENRRLFNMQLRKAIDSSSSHSQQDMLIFIDLDNFKEINDTMGHEIGDELLKELAHRLTLIVRTSDHLARMGGDEFAILVFNQPDNGHKLVQRINQELSEPMIINDLEVQVTVSIGIAAIDPQSTSPSELMRCADLAMYHAKSQGRNTYQHFSDNMKEKVQVRLNLTRELRTAIKQQQFQLYYQAKLSFEDCATIKGAEALIRWIHPEQGMISPARFIPVAEETGLIMEIGDWVLTQACQEVVHFMAQTKRSINVAVNISARQFYGPSLVQTIARILEDTHLPPEQLEVEITEGVMLSDIKHATDILKQLKALGVRIAMDDFGTGFSSLNYLRQLPIDVLKIDRSFIHHMFDHTKNQAIVKTIIELGKHLNMEVVAEGIETKKEAEFLREQGCHTGQGFLFARPAPIESLPVAIEPII